MPRFNKIPWFAWFVFAAAAHFAPAQAGDACRLIFTNSLSEEIVAIRVAYSTPYGEPRFTSSTIFLPPDEDYQLGVQGTTLPEQIILDMATKSYLFTDLSGLNPDQSMHLEARHSEGVPLLRRIAADEAEIKGQERDYLTTENRPNAVDRDHLTACTTWEEVESLVRDTCQAELERRSPAKTTNVEAGPIWNQEHAAERCPEAIREWRVKNGLDPEAARWNGHWSTTVPNEMSVCGCVEGTADLAGTLFTEDSGWGRTLYFPLSWLDWQGVARVQAMDKRSPEEGLGFDLRFRLPGAKDGETGKMLNSFMSDLRVDQLRPWSFRLRTTADPTEAAAADEAKGTAAEANNAGEFEVFYKNFSGDKYDAQDALEERLFSAYEGGRVIEGVATWVREEAFLKAQSGEEVPSGFGVMLLFSRGTFEAVFIPDGRMLMNEPDE